MCDEQNSLTGVEIREKYTNKGKGVNLIFFPFPTNIQNFLGTKIILFWY